MTVKNKLWTLRSRYEHNCFRFIGEDVTYSVIDAVLLTVAAEKEKYLEVEMTSERYTVVDVKRRNYMFT